MIEMPTGRSDDSVLRQAGAGDRALRPVRVLRIAPLASSTGRYGGPFDTAVGQALLAQTDPYHVVTLLAPHLRDDAPRARAIPHPLQFDSPLVRRLLPIGDFLMLSSFRALVALRRRTSDADVVHLSFSRELFPVSAMVVAILTRTRIVLQPHGMLTSRSSLAHRFVDRIIRPLFRKADAVIALTQKEATDLESWAGRGVPPILVVGNPVKVDADLEALSRVPRTRAALFIARLHPRKRVLDFVDAARAARAKGWLDDAYVVVGPDQGDLEAVRHASCDIANLDYEGALPGDEVIERLSKARVFVLPSRDEPWGNVLVASLSIGVPVVITRSAALRPLLEGAGVAVVVPDEDPAAIADAVHNILELSETRYAELSERCQKFARDNLSNDSVRMGLMSCYALALGKPTRTR